MEKWTKKEECRSRVAGTDGGSSAQVHKRCRFPFEQCALGEVSSGCRYAAVVSGGVCERNFYDKLPEYQDN